MDRTAYGWRVAEVAATKRCLRRPGAKTASFDHTDMAGLPAPSLMAGAQGNALGFV